MAPPETLELKMLKTTLLTTLVMAAVVGTGTPASAQPDPPAATTYSRAIRVSDLDLSSDEGARALVHRIRLTAARVCTRASGRVATDPLLSTSRDFRDCVQKATGQAVATLNHPMVNALYARDRKVQVAGY